MRTEQLKYFITIAELGSFSKAADVLNISQPSLSLAIHHLEQELNCVLLQRSHGGATLTDIGKHVYKHAKNILNSLEAIKDEVDNYTSLRKGNIYLGSVNAGSNTLLPNVLSTFNKIYPNIQIRVRETGSLDIATAVRNGELHLGLVVRSPEQPQFLEGLVVEDLISSSLVVCVPSKHKLSKKSVIRIEDIVSEPFIFFRKGYLMHEILTSLMAGRNTKAVYYTDNTESAKRMVASGVGLMLLPEMSIVEDALLASGLIVYIPLSSPASKIFLSIVRSPDQYMPVAVKVFADMLRKEANGYKAHSHLYKADVQVLT